MTIKELKRKLDGTPGTHIRYIFIKFELSNKLEEEKKELKDYNKCFSFNNKCLDLKVISWEKDNKLFSNKLIVKVFEKDYLELLEGFYCQNRYFK